jgi:hypothetical protein
VLHFPHGHQEDDPQRNWLHALACRQIGRHRGAENNRHRENEDDITRIDVKIDKLDINIHRELETIKGQIDHALECIAAIEKHLGIQKKIAA